MGQLHNKLINHNGYGYWLDQTITIGESSYELTYVGYFKGQYKHGPGILYNEQITIITVWENNQIHGYGELFINNAKYCGTLLEIDHKLTYHGIGSTECESYFGSNKISCTQYTKGLYDSNKLTIGSEIKIAQNFIKSVRITKIENSIQSVVDLNIADITKHQYITSFSNKLQLHLLIPFFSHCTEETPIENYGEMIKNEIDAIDTIQMINNIDGIKINKLTGISHNCYHYQATMGIKPVFLKAHLILSDVEKYMHSWEAELLSGSSIIGSCSIEREPILCNIVTDLSQKPATIKLQEISNKEKANNKPLFYIKVFKYLEDSMFLNKICRRSESTLNDIMHPVVAAFFMCRVLEAMSIYHGNINSHHLWFNSADAILIDYSNSQAFNKGSLINMYTHINKSDTHSDKYVSYEEKDKGYSNVELYNHMVDTKMYKYLSYEEKYNIYNYKTDISKQYSLFRRDATALAFTMFKSVINLLRVKYIKTPSYYDRLKLLWRKATSLRSLNFLVSSVADIKKLQTVYMHRLFIEIITSDKFSSLPNSNNCQDLLLLCYSIICNTSIKDITKNKDFLSVSSNTSYACKALEQNQATSESFATFKQIAVHLNNTGFENIYFRETSETTINLGSPEKKEISDEKYLVSKL